MKKQTDFVFATFMDILKNRTQTSIHKSYVEFECDKAVRDGLRNQA